MAMSTEDKPEVVEFDDGVSKEVVQFCLASSGSIFVFESLLTPRHRQRNAEPWQRPRWWPETKRSSRRCSKNHRRSLLRLCLLSRVWSHSAARLPTATTAPYLVLFLPTMPLRIFTASPTLASKQVSSSATFSRPLTSARHRHGHVPDWLCRCDPIHRSGH